MQLSIERIRSMVLGAGALLIAALIAFLAAGRWKSRFDLSQVPRRLGANIQQEANGVTYTQARGGHTLFKIHASKVVQLKQGGRALLHDVQIELYGEDGSRVDRIAGNEFEYDQKAGTAVADGPVEIVIMRPGVAPAVAPKATPSQAIPDKAKGNTLGNVAETVSAGQIRVKTSGLTFDQKSGTATTAQHVEFATLQGDGSSTGASFDSENGRLVLDRDVVLNVHKEGEAVLIHAQHAAFDRTELTCDLNAASAKYRDGEATAGKAQILFRRDGSAVRLNAESSFGLTTATGAHLQAPQGVLEFDEHNQPRTGHLQGGVTLASDNDNRSVHGSAPTADLTFTSKGDLEHAHLERGVQLHSEQTDASAKSPTRIVRDWHSDVADVDFRNAGENRLELAAIHGKGGVTLASETQTGSSVTPSRLSADQVNAIFAANDQLSQVLGSGHASLEQTTANGARQTTTGDRLEARFLPASPGAAEHRPARGGNDPQLQIQSVTVDGNVVLVNTPAPKPGQPAQAPMRATAGRAVYEGTGDWLHLTLNPRVDDGGMQISADRLDVSRQSGDALAHGNVKATWLDSEKPGSGRAAVAIPTLGAQGPAHVIAAEAQFNQTSGEATFKGHARLWQQANSVEAPVLVLDRTHQTLVAHGNGNSEPVRLVMLSSGSLTPGAKGKDGKPSSGNSVVRVKAANLRYSAPDRKAVLHAGPGGSVIAESASSTTSADEVELLLQPQGQQKNSGATQVDRLTARGHVSIASMGRHGTGEQLVYSGQTEEYVLTGTATAPPRMTDPEHGTVSGTALIFNSRDDSVRVEGTGNKTTTETHVPR